MNVLSPKWGHIDQNIARRRIFFDTPSQLEKRIERMVEHFRHAEWIFENQKLLHRKDSRRKATSDLLWLLVQDAMHTVRNMPDNDRRRLAKLPTIMPGTRISFQEAYEIELSRLQAGMSQYDYKEQRSTINQSDVARMVDVLDLMRLVQHRNARLMVRVTLARAAGLSIEQCGRIWDRHRIDFDRRAFHDIKSRTLGQILLGLEVELGLAKSARGLRRLTQREIEHRARLRKKGGLDAG